MKKDDYLATIMQIPPKQHIPIVQFDAKTQMEAFTVSAEGIKGVCLVLCVRRTMTTVLIPLVTVECRNPDFRVCASSGRSQKAR